MRPNVTRLFGKHLFAHRADPAAVRALIAEGHDIDAADNADGWTVLHYLLNPVTFEPSVEIVEILLAHGTAVNRTDRRGWTPLHFAARTGSRAVIERLLAAGADVGSVDDEGISPLHRYVCSVKATAAYDLELVRLLLAAGAQVTPGLRQFVTAVVRADQDALRAVLDSEG